MKIFGYLKNSKIAVFFIILLLIVQAFCDLALPSYTSDIVDVGIQQNGIENAVPQVISADSMNRLKLFMPEDEIDLVDKSYRLGSAGNYEINDVDEDEIERLNDIFAVPMAMLSMGKSAGKFDVDQLIPAVQSGALDKQSLLNMRGEAEQSFGNIGDSIVDQTAVQFVKAEYESLGIDMEKLQMDYLWETGGKMLGFTLLMVVAAVLVGLIASRTAAKIGMQLRSDVFAKVISFSHAEIDKFSTASLITRNTNDIQQIQMVIVMLLRVVLFAPIIGIGGIIMVSRTNTGMSWIIVVAVAFILCLVGALVSVAMPKFKKMQTLLDNINLISREILTGIPVIRAFSREKYEEKRFEKANADLTRTQLFTSRVMTFMMPAMMLAMNGISVMIVWFGSKGIDAGNLQVGDMIAFITYTMQIIMAFMMITMVSIMLPRANVAAERVNEVLNTEIAINDKPQVLDESVKNFTGRVKFDNVSFAYPNAGEDAVKNISFEACPGKTTAIIGSTGCGKSTIVNLILRFYDVTKGGISIDGVDIRDISQNKLRSLIGYVPQKAVLFSGDIRSNIKFSDESMSNDSMVEAAQIAQARDFIESKTEQYDSQVAQGGTNVSGGQKQRLSIARAIAKNPKIFLFDDSFSALDYKTDAALRRELNKKVGDATVIIVAQRISTILHADQIIVLDDGEIAGIGTHEQLLEKCETYREIARSQLSEEELSLKEGEKHERP